MAAFITDSPEGLWIEKNRHCCAHIYSMWGGHDFDVTNETRIMLYRYDLCSATKILNAWDHDLQEYVDYWSMPYYNVFEHDYGQQYLVFDVPLQFEGVYGEYSGSSVDNCGGFYWEALSSNASLDETTNGLEYIFPDKFETHALYTRTIKNIYSNENECGKYTSWIKNAYSISISLDHCISFSSQREQKIYENTKKAFSNATL